MSPTPVSGGFSLFPNTNPQRPPSRTQTHQTPRSRATTPQPVVEVTPPPVETNPFRTGRKPSVRRNGSVRDGRQTAASNGRQSAMDGRMSSLDRREDVVIERPAPVVAVNLPPRYETPPSDAQPIGRSNTRSSIAKPPVRDPPSYEPPSDGPSSSSGEPGLRSMFPTYNPSVPLDRQDYYPTQASPTHIPRNIISRPLYSPTFVDPRTPGPALRSPMSAATPMSAASVGRWPPRSNEPPVIPPTSKTEELKGLWKVANGWKASASEGRTYCMKMTAEKDCPIYTLSSDTQPFYNLRVDPTSASAYVALSRHDPQKPYRGTPVRSSNASGVSTTSKAEGKHWQEVLATTLEEESRKLPPNDGLVALLYPSAATKMALDRPDDAAIAQRAEQECARLVWDNDTNNYFLVHPALAMPFGVTIERNSAWSRTEYVLEHLESPQHLAKLTRDATRSGWLEVDTATAAKIDSAFLVDVAIAALMLVAHKDDQFTRVEVFEPPPVFGGGSPGGSLRSKRNSKSSRASRRESRREEKKEKKEKKKAAKSRMEEFEIDIESQASDIGKRNLRDKDKLPGTARGLIAVLSALFKCVIWIVTIGFKALAAIVAGLARCVGAEKR